MEQIILGALAFTVGLFLLYLLYNKRKKEEPDVETYTRLSMDSLLEDVKLDLAEFVRDDTTVTITDVKYDEVIARRNEAEQAMVNSVNGEPYAMKLVTALIRNIIEEKLPDMETVNQVIDFSDLASLPPMTKWEILCYKISERGEGNLVIDYLDDTYDISKPRVIDDSAHDLEMRSCFDYKMLDSIFLKEVELPPDDWDEEAEGVYCPILYSEALDIIARLLFNRYKGIGCITTLRSMRVDGFNFGTSGSTRYMVDNTADTTYTMLNSVWVQIKAVWVHFSFLSFETEGEMMRIISQLTSSDLTAPMTERNAKKVLDDFEGSRITAIRKPVGECWSCYIRKHTAKLMSMEQFLSKPGITNWELPAKLVKFLMKAGITSGFTGQQNTGKTTFMKIAIGLTRRLNIRVLEMSFELALRELYPTRNIFTAKPTDYTSASEIQDTFKKTDSGLSCCGEVAEDIVAARMIQFCLIGSPFTIFSHHGRDDYGLINGLANSLVSSKEYGDHEVAFSTVLDCIKSNIHFGFSGRNRVIEYISEIVKEDEVQPYPELKEALASVRRELGNQDVDALTHALCALFQLQKEFYTRSTDRVRFKSRRIVYFDKDTQSYMPGEWYTEEMERKILDNLTYNERREFLAFKEQYWGCNK